MTNTPHPDDTATGDMREAIASMFTDEGEHFERKLDEIMGLLSSYKQQVLDELDGRLPKKRKVTYVPTGGSGYAEVFDGSSKFNEALEQVHQVIKEMKEES